MDIFKIDSSICDYYSETKEDEEGANIIVGWCHDNGCECSEVPFDECITKAIEYCKLKDKQIQKLKEALKAKEQELEEFRVVIRKDICSHYVLGECSQKHHNNCVGRNQCIKDLEQECEELKEIANNALDKVNNYLDKKEKSLLYKQTLAEIKELLLKTPTDSQESCINAKSVILQKISEVSK